MYLTPCILVNPNLTPRAAVSDEVVGGSMYEPENGGLRGYPTLASIQENAMDETVAKKLWHFAEQATSIHFAGSQGCRL